jgi:hypothetical protein
MNQEEKQRLSEIRQGAKDGMREGYLRASGIKTLPALDIEVLLDRIDTLETWIHQEAFFVDVCTWSLFGEACDGCKCKHRDATKYAEELVNMDEWDDGASAAHTGAAKEENPHPKNVQEWDAWNAGYDAESQTFAEHVERVKPGDCCPAEVEATLQNWPVVDYVPDAGKLCAEMDEEFALASESQREAAGTADEKPDGQAENATVEARREVHPNPSDG